VGLLARQALLGRGRHLIRRRLRIHPLDPAHLSLATGGVCVGSLMGDTERANHNVGVGHDLVQEARVETFLRAFARAMISVPRAFKADLLRGRGMSASENFTLMHLSEAPGRRLRMSDLAACDVRGHTLNERRRGCAIPTEESRLPTDDFRGFTRSS
jgi:hypothetical protein